jgi:Uri superfamily endonuclease
MRGTYTVLLNCGRLTTIRIGRLGCFKLQEGCYFYTGSGLGVGAVSLEGRIERHKRRSKTLRWHVDYLTSNENWNFTGAVYVVSKRRLECRINRLICCSLHALPVIPKFGSSDCNCLTHLFRFDGALKGEKLLKELESLYVRFGSPVWIHAETD